MQLGYKKQVETPFEEAAAKTREALAGEGFGVISEIDVRATFLKKLDKDFGNYLILGACHPESAYAILSEDKELGLLLPCNVIVYQDGDVVTVSAILPSAMLASSDNQKLAVVADEIEKKLKKVIDNI